MRPCALVPFLMLFVHMVDRRRRTLFSNALHSEDQKKYFKDKDHETESAEWFSRVLDSLWDGWCRVAPSAARERARKQRTRANS